MKYISTALLVFAISISGQAQTANTQSTSDKARPHGSTTPLRPPLPAFINNPETLEFIRQMVDNHGFCQNVMEGLFARINPSRRVIDLADPPPSRPLVRSWKKYSSAFLNESRIQGGAAFWREHTEILERAYELYGVPPEIIVAIVGVETMYGRNKGNFNVLESLASLAFYSQRRSEFFKSELEHFLLLARENGYNPLVAVGSYAGAIGIPQFMPGSWRRYAVDFDGDGKIDLENNVIDSIGSIANYMKEHGWEKDMPVAHRITIRGRPLEEWLRAGMLPSLSVSSLVEQGVKVVPNAPEMAAFIDLPTPDHPTEYWLGFQNYYVITRYNRSSFYAMSVFLLAESIKGRMMRR